MRKTSRILCVLLCVAMLALTVVCAPKPQLSASAATLAELQAQLDAAKANSNELKAQIAALEKANAPYEQQKAALKKQISATQKEIDLYQSQINALENEVQTLEKSIAQTEIDLRRSINQFKQRLVAIYTSGNFYSGLEMLGSSTDLSQLLSKNQLMESMSKKDNKLLETMLSHIDELAAQQEKLAAEREKLAASKQIIDTKKTELTAQYNKVNSIVQKNEGAIHNLESKQKDYAQMQKDLAAAIEKKKQEQSSPSISGSGRFVWPVPGYYRLSEEYGYRICPYHGKENHSGIDISSSGIYGAKIVAADSGEIILSKYYGGYGNCVMIDHNNGYVTLYAHMKALSPLKVGAKVNKGDVVGYVGSSGNSTGPHLHFEIQKNGKTVDPMSFF